MTRNICLLLVTLLGSAVTGGVFPGMGECGAEEKAVWLNAASLFPANRTPDAAEGKKVGVFYCHYTIRCGTCMRMEEYSKFAVQAGFSGELKSGRIEWRAVNMQLAENRHFMQDYRLHRSSLVIVRFKNGEEAEWRVLEKTWEYVGDMDKFVKYVQSNIRAFLEAD